MKMTHKKNKKWTHTKKHKMENYEKIQETICIKM